ncbi:MAG TPA: hypothetical protein VKS62_15655 [Methylomirabilota bacterium]|jgi:fluoroacetyl-CoA thioesterase|nr:hypothetical protein [Methylomirabilota bacterium]
MPLVPGQTAEVQRVVTHDLTADVRAKAVLRETDGRRCLFDVEAWDEVEKIAEGRHERYVVSNLARFLARAS